MMSARTMAMRMVMNITRQIRMSPSLIRFPAVNSSRVGIVPVGERANDQFSSRPFRGDNPHRFWGQSPFVGLNDFIYHLPHRDQITVVGMKLGDSRL